MKIKQIKRVQEAFFPEEIHVILAQPERCGHCSDWEYYLPDEGTVCETCVEVLKEEIKERYS